MSLACHRLPPPPWFTRPVPAAHGVPAAGPPLCVTALRSASGSSAVCVAVPADSTSVSCSSQVGFPAPAQRVTLCGLATAVPARSKAAAGSRPDAVTAGDGRTTSSRAYRPAALPSDATNISAEAHDTIAALTPGTSVGGGGTGGGDGRAGGGGGRGGSDGAGEEPSERPPVGGLLLVPLAAAAVLAARWALARQRPAGAHAGAMQQETVNRSEMRCRMCVGLS